MLAVIDGSWLPRIRWGHGDRPSWAGGEKDPDMVNDMGRIIFEKGSEIGDSEDDKELFEGWDLMDSDSNDEDNDA